MPSQTGALFRTGKKRHKEPEPKRPNCRLHAACCNQQHATQLHTHSVGIVESSLWERLLSTIACDRLSECVRYGKSMFFLGWHEIRQTLYESLPEGVVHFGKRFQSYSDEGDGGVTLRFKARPSPTQPHLPVAPADK